MKRSMTIFVCMAIALFAVAALTACSGSQSGGSSAGTAPAAVDVTAQDSGQTKTLQVGQQLKVGLDANPTTGYTWAVDGEVPAQLKQDGEPVYKAETSGVVGGGGTQLWTFTGASAGSGVLKLKYWRSFEATVPPVKTFTLNVDVK